MINESFVYNFQYFPEESLWNVFYFIFSTYRVCAYICAKENFLSFKSPYTKALYKKKSGTHEKTIIQRIIKSHDIHFHLFLSIDHHYKLTISKLTN